ncbi:hypothetical protein NS355_09445 [Sphingomonas yabuuchiae]|uniref:Uncharacterized protein n=1 Tax=Sphingomonas yabuuchiae TaxID=172044 RepID=A0A147IS39_9SPHN|nr:hypothetical protein NS355_09445 [Sphingomonas yabuuchiae]
MSGHDRRSGDSRRDRGGENGMRIDSNAAANARLRGRALDRLLHGLIAARHHLHISCGDWRRSDCNGLANRPDPQDKHHRQER